MGMLAEKLGYISGSSKPLLRNVCSVVSGSLCVEHVRIETEEQKWGTSDNRCRKVR